MTSILSIVDLILAPIYLVVFFFIAQRIRTRNIEKNPSYKYFVPGLMVKMVGAIAVCLIYVYYYGAGDTINYHYDCVAASKLFLKNPWQAIRFTFLPLDADIWYSFDNDTGWLLYSYDDKAIVVDKINWIFALVNNNSFAIRKICIFF